MIESPNGTSCIVLSIPRAGTHMLMKVLKLIGLKEFIPRGGIGIYNQHLLPLKGHFEYGGHFPVDMEPIALMHQHGYKGVFISRDLRDILVSHACYGIYDSIKQGKHPLYRKFDTHDINEVIDWLIEYEHYRYWARIGWKNVKGILHTRYETLWSDPFNEIKNIADHLDIHLTRDELRLIEEDFPPKRGDQSYSSYFRQGEPGNWKEYFTSDHKEKFKKIAGQILIDEGYEKDMNW